MRNVYAAYTVEMAGTRSNEAELGGLKVSAGEGESESPMSGNSPAIELLQPNKNMAMGTFTQWRMTLEGKHKGCCHEDACPRVCMGACACDPS